LRQKLAYAALLACLALNLALPASPAGAQVRLPSLGEAEADELSVLDERRIGDQIMRQIYQDPDVVDDPVLFEYVDDTFEKLLAAARERGNVSPDENEALAWQPFLVRDRTFNAFALPGGYIGVHLGLIAASGSPDELASVLGHELSHITQRHIARAAVAGKRQSLATAAAMILGLIAASRSGNPDIPIAVITSGQAAMATGQLTFSREMEREADRFGLDVMTTAGYSPTGMASMFERLDTATRLNDSNQYPWLRSHPLTIERLAEARLRVRTNVPVDTHDSPVTEHALMRARARMLVDTSEPALRALQQQARAGGAANDSERLGQLYGGAMASIHLRDYAQSDAFLAAAQQVLAAHATAAKAWATTHPLQPAGVALTGAAKPGGTQAEPSSAPTFAEMFTPPASGASGAAAASGATSGAVVAAGKPVWPIEPVVARDFALLRLELAIARRSLPDITAAEEALGADRSRPVVLAHADAALGRSLAHDPHAAAALQRETESLQTWVAVHPKDALAWSMLAQCADPLGQKLRAIRAEAESHAAVGDLVGALDRLRAGQQMARKGVSNGDFVEVSIIDSRFRELEAQRRELAKEFGQR
jgi:predicted Zn-dependent protease